MNRIVVDTDVASFLFKNHSIGSHYRSLVESSICLVSFMTVAELYQWTIEANFGPQRREWLGMFLKGFTVVPSSPDLCQGWAEAMTTSKARGRRMDTADAFIAATALLYDIPLLSHNRRDYLGLPNLKLISHG